MILKSDTEQTDLINRVLHFEIVGIGHWELATERQIELPSEHSGARVIMKSVRPSTYLTTEELGHVVAAKFDEADLIAAQVLKTAEYRAYRVGIDGHFIDAIGFECKDDEAAVEHAKQFLDGYDVELWSGTRPVTTLERRKL
jgi:hypothetical protein